MSQEKMSEGEIVINSSINRSKFQWVINVDSFKEKTVGNFMVSPIFLFLTQSFPKMTGN